MMMNSVKKVLVSEMVTEEIKEYIKHNNLKNGDKLLSMAELCKRLNVSRSSVREALSQLVANDIIEVINGKGIFVKNTDTYRIEARIKVENEKKTLLYLCEVRRSLEGTAVELAAEKASKEWIDKMEYYLNECQRLRDLGESDAMMDLAFHQAIYKSAGNPVLESVIESIWNMFTKFWRQPFGIEKMFIYTFPLHKTLFQAIKIGNKKQARKEFDQLMDALETKIQQVK
jgi:GntR family transcriptional repressor for pyruvate dehydrogenase complex